MYADNPGTSSPDVSLSPEITSNKVWNTADEFTNIFMTPDGIIYSFAASTFSATSSGNTVTALAVLMDVNGVKRPNIAGQDLFLLGINIRGKVVDMTCYFYDACSTEDYGNLFGNDLIMHSAAS